jgi:hypothetical protein
MSSRKTGKSKKIEHKHEKLIDLTPEELEEEDIAAAANTVHYLNQFPSFGKKRTSRKKTGHLSDAIFRKRSFGRSFGFSPEVNKNFKLFLAIVAFSSIRSFVKGNKNFNSEIKNLELDALITLTIISLFDIIEYTTGIKKEKIILSYILLNLGADLSKLV